MKIFYGVCSQTSTVFCRIIYFGGYGCKTMWDVQNTPSANFVVEEMSWVSCRNTSLKRGGGAHLQITFQFLPPTFSHTLLSGNHWKHLIQVLGLEQ